MSDNQPFTNFITERLNLVIGNSPANFKDSNLVRELLTSDIYELLSSYYTMTDVQKHYIKETIKNLQKHKL